MAIYTKFTHNTAINILVKSTGFSLKALRATIPRIHFSKINKNPTFNKNNIKTEP